MNRANRLGYEVGWIVKAHSQWTVAYLYFESFGDYKSKCLIASFLSLSVSRLESTIVQRAKQFVAITILIYKLKFVKIVCVNFLARLIYLIGSKCCWMCEVYLIEKLV